MHLKAITSLALAAAVLAAPEQQQKRQDVTELLALATEAGITLPTDPAALLALGPAAQSLADALPTAPVLSALETAAPSGFISEMLHNPSYASSFESAFAAGSSPSWFKNLPTSVRQYLHTYSNFPAAGTAAGAAINLISSNATAGGTGSSTGSMTSSMTTSSSMMTTTGGSAGATQMGGSDSSGSSPPAKSTSAASAGDAPRPAGAFAAGMGLVVGFVGIVAAL